MSTIHRALLTLAVLLPPADLSSRPELDTARLREMLLDRQHPRGQSQAALLLVQSRSADAEDVVRDGLRQTDSPAVFLALASALRLNQDPRFTDELVAALGGEQSLIRQSAVDTLAGLADGKAMERLQALVQDADADPATRRAALEVLGRTGRKPAFAVLFDQLANENDTLRRAAAEALAELTGQNYGIDVNRWRNWWERRKDLANERWLEERLAYQASRSHRLKAELERAQAEAIGLHQQLYGRLPPGDRLGHVLKLADSEDPAIRALSVSWGVELLAASEAAGQHALAELFLRLCQDGTPDVRRSAVLALGHLSDARAFDRLRVLLERSPVTVRAAAARALAQQVKGSGQGAWERRRRAIAALQKALDDPALEVVVEAAESLGTLGIPEAGPVLAVLLRHPSKPVRQTAALALERVADLTALDALLGALDDPAVSVRFSLVGALGHAIGQGQSLGEPQRARLVQRLEGLLLRDADPGVRGRAATVLGECASAPVLPALWQRVLANEDGRVQEKAWSAMLEILARSGSLELLQEWDHTLVKAKQEQRRLQLLSEIHGRWQKGEENKAAAGPALELLVQAELAQGKWAAAFPHVRELLTRPANDSELERRLRWLLAVGEQALHEGNRPEVRRVVQEAQPFLTRKAELAGEFDELEKQAKQR